jgi:hypothetical protein
MNRREIELITGLAEGRLEDESEARALIDFSTEARKAYEEQLQALSALGSLPSASLTSTEKATLKRELWTALTTPVAEGPLKSSPRRQGQWAFVAAGLFVVAGLFGAMGLLGGGDGGLTFGGPAQADQVTTDAESATPPRTDDALEERLFVLADQARTGVLSFADDFEGLSEQELDELGRCMSQAGVAEHRPVGAFTDGGVQYAIVVPEGSELGPDTPLAFVDLETCRLALSDD